MSTELSSIDQHGSRVTMLAQMGASLFKDAPEPSVMTVPPRHLQEGKRFRLPFDSSFTTTTRNYFLYPLPTEVDYKLISGCVASIFVAVHVDHHGVVHVDGTSDSLITKAILALILDTVEHKDKSTVLQLTSVDVGHESTLALLGFMKRDGVSTILNHIKSEIRAQSGSIDIQKSRKSASTIRDTKKIAALISGGVDSSVALWLLKSRGYNVEAFYLKVWGVDKETESGNCQWATDVEHAMGVCKQLDVPLHILPFQELYHNLVLDPFIEGTRLGETPNPDVCCNQFIKFGTFLDYATRWGFSHVASGHYASVVVDTNRVNPLDKTAKVTRLRLCKDQSKDQTYFLSRLTQSQLQRAMFPLCDLYKHEVRAIARTLGFSNHDRKESMGLCFLGKVNVKSFLSDCLGHYPGPIVDCDTMERIGEHPGLYHFTIGQREGIAQYLNSVRETHRARNVVGKDLESNTLYVSTCYHTGKYIEPGSIRRRFYITDLTWIIPDYQYYIDPQVTDPQHLSIKLRHSPFFAKGTITFNNSAIPMGATVDLDRADVGLATGQYAVIYAGNDCIGAGKIVANQC
ncbi:tRNA methyl transferase family protein [Babesia ovis]|uniref:tRNA-5-taurinomethyluridine 2-sulfurtransferase n=1 Tax=Babesia ovis TaxID=5869 RepID=A0A9W5T9G3_BABOV|nr:tRNA methyl transferase family protein [Babesia ovis]